MKHLLVISPSFPPANAADMHRVRQSVSYLEELGWKPTVVVVEPSRTEGVMDPLLSQTLPPDLEVITVKAFSTRWTRKLGLGSLALRSLWYYFRVVTALLHKRQFDLVYFSTTMFPVTILGAYWKRRFGVPYVIDMQDPWYSDHYLKVPPSQRPPKFWFSYYSNKFLEPIAMQSVDGIISVSQGYCDVLQGRYSNITPENCTVIPFGAFARDFQILKTQRLENRFFEAGEGLIHVAYVGRGGFDMDQSATLIFKAFAAGLAGKPELFGRVRMYFIGTSYAPGNQGRETIKPVAEIEGVGAFVREYPGRVPYFEALHLLQSAQMLMIPGSSQASYTASKLYPYIMAQKPLLAVFNRQSSVVEILNQTEAGEFVMFDENIGNSTEKLVEELHAKWLAMLEKLPFTPATNWQAFEPFTAKEMTRKQVVFFEKICGQYYPDY